MQQLQLNIIPFLPPVAEVTIPIYKDKVQGFYSFFIDEEVTVLIGDNMTLLEIADRQWIYKKLYSHSKVVK